MSFARKQEFSRSYSTLQKHFFCHCKVPNRHPTPPPAISYVGLDVLFQFVPQILLSISTYMHVLAAGC